MDRISNAIELQIAVKVNNIGAVGILAVRDNKRRQIVAVQRRKSKLWLLSDTDDMPPHRGHRVTGAVLCGDDAIGFRGGVRRKSGRTQGERCGKRAQINRLIFINFLLSFLTSR